MSAYVDPRIAKYGAGHGFDIPYVFDTFGSLQLTQGQRDLSKSMMHAWATFAKTGDAGWTAYDPKLDDYMAFDETSGMQSGWHSAICDAWDSL